MCGFGRNVGLGATDGKSTKFGDSSNDVKSVGTSSITMAIFSFEAVGCRFTFRCKLDRGCASFPAISTAVLFTNPICPGCSFGLFPLIGLRRPRRWLNSMLAGGIGFKGGRDLETLCDHLEPIEDFHSDSMTLK
jgi:hypothetical protein